MDFNIAFSTVTLIASIVVAAIAYGGFLLKTLASIHTERITLEQEKTAKEYQHRKLAENQVERMLADQDLILEQVKWFHAATQRISDKTDTLNHKIVTALKQSTEQNEQLAKLAADMLKQLNSNH